MFCTFTLSLAFLLSSSPDRKDSTEPPTRKAIEALKVVGDISGYYRFNGVEIGGKQYKGVCVITRKEEIYIVQWIVGVGSNFTGIGIRQGDTLSVGWALQTERGLLRGINTYRIEPGKEGPTLIGRWATLPGAGRLQVETMRFLHALEKDDD